ncbi:MAG: S9 family peptidase [Melioribacteraceae bacterium]|nr:S9 family peptidase [Melioribacteraceae bacterium]
MKNFILLVLLFLFSNLATAQEKHALSIDDLWTMNRIGSIDLSPDGKTIAYSVTTYSMEENKGNSDIWVVSADGTNPKCILKSKESESSPLFMSNSKISFIKKGQLWNCNLDGTNQIAITGLYSGVSGVEFSKENDKIVFSSMVYPDLVTQSENKKRDEEKETSKVKAKVFTELMYKHWNDWRGPKRSHLFLFDLNKKDYTDLNLNSKFDVPTIALGSSNDYSFSPNSDEIAFTMNDSEVLATSTNNEIFLLNLADVKNGKKTPIKKISVSEGNDNQPVYSPDGKYIAFRSMARAGFEADKQTLVLYNRNTGELKNLTDDLDISFGEMVWSPDSKDIYYNSANEIYNSIYRFNIESGKNELLKEKVVSSNLILSEDGKKLFFKHQRSTFPYEIFSMNLDGTELKQITATNKNILADIDMNEVEYFWTEGANGARVQSIIVKPPFFDENKKYPMVFLIHGGPQGHWQDDFHFRWNLQMFAAPGYVVVATNPRGSVGYGQKFTDEISQDWGGKVYTDLMNSYDYAVNNYKYIDKNKTFAAGASYGGYMINWIEGHTDRFTALVCHAGVYNMESMYGVTEELWFPEWEMGGTPWENPELYKKWSPHNYVENFKTPMLVIHGAYDFRVPEGQAFELFTALQKMKVESKLLYFPDEYHFVTKPQNAKLWWNSIYNWFKKF